MMPESVKTRKGQIGAVCKDGKLLHCANTFRQMAAYLVAHEPDYVRLYEFGDGWEFIGTYETGVV